MGWNKFATLDGRFKVLSLGVKDAAEVSMAFVG